MKALAAIIFCLATAADAAEPNAEYGGFLFQQYCTACHGLEARGNGTMHSILAVPAPDLTRLSAENDGVFPLFRVLRQMDGRDPLLAHGGEMPLYGHLFDFPDVLLVLPLP